MQNNNFNPQDFWKLVDQNDFKNFVDRLFGFDMVTPMQNFMNQSAQMMQMWQNTAKEASKNWGQMFGNGMPFFSSMSQMNPGSMADWYTEMMRSTQRSFTPFFANTQTGNTPPYSVQPMFEMMEKWGNNVTKTNQLQSMYYRTSVAAWEKVVQVMSDKAGAGEAMTDFNEFYNLWSTINEQEFVALFNTEEYAALQGELIKHNSELNRMYEKQMEAYLQPFPVVFRSQLDEVYKINHELRSKINELERTVNEIQKQNKSASGQDGKTPKKEK